MSEWLAGWQKGLSSALLTTTFISKPRTSNSVKKAWVSLLSFNSKIGVVQASSSIYKNFQIINQGSPNSRAWITSMARKEGYRGHQDANGQFTVDIGGKYVEVVGAPGVSEDQIRYTTSPMDLLKHWKSCILWSKDYFFSFQLAYTIEILSSNVLF